MIASVRRRGAAAAQLRGTAKAAGLPALDHGIAGVNLAASPAGRGRVTDAVVGEAAAVTGVTKTGTASGTGTAGGVVPAHAAHGETAGAAAVLAQIAAAAAQLLRAELHTLPLQWQMPSRRFSPIRSQRSACGRSSSCVSSSFCCSSRLCSLQLPKCKLFVFPFLLPATQMLSS